MSNLKKAFENGKALIPFVTCGDPDLETTANNIRALVENGANAIEIGIPFSDPTAEGPMIQEANIRALQGGVTTDKIFEFVKELRKDVTVPFVFVTYANVVFSYGTERFVKTCAEVGMDGLFIPDVPFEEKEEFDGVCKQYGVDLISMIAPTSKKRISKIAKEATGFVYVVSNPSTANEELAYQSDVSEVVKEIRAYTDVPCIISSGISTVEQASQMAAVGDGIVVEVAVTGLVAHYGKKSTEKVAEYAKQMAEAIKN